MPLPLCVKCRRSLYPVKNGVLYVEVFDDGDVRDAPYAAYHCDKWGCHYCDTVILRGFAKEPCYGHWKEGFQKFLDNYQGEIIYEKLRGPELRYIK